MFCFNIDKFRVQLFVAFCVRITVDTGYSISDETWHYLRIIVDVVSCSLALYDGENSVYAVSNDNIICGTALTSITTVKLGSDNSKEKTNSLAPFLRKVIFEKLFDILTCFECKTPNTLLDNNFLTILYFEATCYLFIINTFYIVTNYNDFWLIKNTIKNVGKDFTYPNCFLRQNF